MGEKNLNALFSPRSIAVVGASPSEGKVGRVLLENIIRSGFPGQVYAVNPKHDEILGVPCYPSVTAIPDTPQLAVIAVPAPLVESVLEDCGTKGVEVAVVISAGFKETGSEGYERERNLRITAEKHGIRVLGPNCLGVADTFTPLNATFAAYPPPPGKVAFISQSGALCTAALSWANENGFGFSRFVSLGNKMDLDESDILGVLEEDDNTSVVAAYLEGIDNGNEFVRVARSLTRKKPVIVFKAGTTQAGARAVSSHTGTLAGSERAYAAAFQKCGVLRAETVEELFQLSRGFAHSRPPGGDRVAIITNAGGPGIITSDAVERSGLHLASFSEETIGKLREKLPPAANIYNPVDVLGDAREDRYELALQAVLQDKGVDSVVVVLTPQAMTRVRETARVVARLAMGTEKTVLAVFMGGKEAEEAEEILVHGGVPNFRFPEEAVRVLVKMREYARYRERKPSQPREFPVDREKVRKILESLISRGRKELVEVESSEILKAYGIPVARSILATNLEECIRAGRTIGYPVVAKIASPNILHKTDVGGVVVNITNTDELINAYERINSNVRRLLPEAEIWGILVQEMLPPSKELIIGANRDTQFGPLLMVGLGGIFVEVLKDVSFRLAPLAEEDARSMLQELRSYWLLKGVRGEPQSDVDSAVEAILRVSQLACDFPEIAEMDINPLRVLEKGKGCIAVDARFVLQH